MKFTDIPEGQLKDIKNNLENGMLEVDVGEMVGISQATYFRWKKDMPEFAEFCRKAVLDYKRKLITAVNIGSLKDGKLALAILEKRWPQEWNTVKKIELVDPEKELERIRKLVYGDEKVSDPSSEPINGEVVETPELGSGDVQK